MSQNVTGDSPQDLPEGLGEHGERLWRAVVEEFDLAEHERLLLQEMARTADELARLREIVDREGVIVRGAGLTQKAHPALVESRQLRIALARLAASLRLPAGDDDDLDGRPQRRSGARGVYGFGAS